MAEKKPSAMKKKTTAATLWQHPGAHPGTRVVIHPHHHHFCWRRGK